MHSHVWHKTWPIKCTITFHTIVLMCDIPAEVIHVPVHLNQDTRDTPTAPEEGEGKEEYGNLIIFLQPPLVPERHYLTSDTRFNVLCHTTVYAHMYMYIK